MAVRVRTPYLFCGNPRRTHLLLVQHGEGRRDLAAASAITGSGSSAAPSAGSRDHRPGGRGCDEVDGVARFWSFSRLESATSTELRWRAEAASCGDGSNSP